jgi:hypothetical protein
MAFNPYSKTTIDTLIESYRDELVTEGTIAFKEKINDQIIVKFHNLLSKYNDLMKKYVIQVDMTEKEYERYKCLPNLLSYDLYGTPEFGYSILYINNMVSMTEFTKHRIKVFSTGISEVLKELMVLAKDDLERNTLQLLD